ncbi:MAG: sigma-54 dependent transcriptional regulator [Pseudomonas marincola]
MKLTTHSILLVEDNLPLARAYEGYLAQQPYKVIPVSTVLEARTVIDTEEIDVILLDINLPDGSGLDFLGMLQENGNGSAVIMITADGSVNQAVEAMRSGARDYLVKPFSADRLRITIENALDRRNLEKTVQKYKQEFDRQTYCDFIGSSLAMQAIYRIVDSAASSEATIFIKGETGTGKELFARAIHQMSPRANKRLVPINCAAIPSELMESEIFGHVRGAFTGANEAREGAAIQADNGTLFLDEICEMDLTLQAKLLRFIQTGTFQKVGSDKLEKVNIRFVCATNRNPLKEVEEGRFREDLYYRLHIVPATLPALRERDNDIMELASHFLHNFAVDEDKEFRGFDPEVETILKSHPWPGNVRELQNVIQRIVVLNKGNLVLKEMLPNDFKQSKTSIPSAPSNQGQTSDVHANLEGSITPMWQVELDYIKLALKKTNNNVPKAAALLEMSPSTIYRRMKELDVNYPR